MAAVERGRERVKKKEAERGSRRRISPAGSGVRFGDEGEEREKRGRGEGEEGDKGSLVINKKMVFDK